MSLKKVAIRGALTLAATGALLGAAQPAFAHLSSVSGSQAWSYSPYGAVAVKDTAADSHSAYANYQRHGNGSTLRIENSNGSGTTVITANDETNYVMQVQACVDIQLEPDSCGGWN